MTTVSSDKRCLSVQVRGHFLRNLRSFQTGILPVAVCGLCSRQAQAPETAPAPRVQEDVRRGHPNLGKVRRRLEERPVEGTLPDDDVRSSLLLRNLLPRSGRHLLRAGKSPQPPPQPLIRSPFDLATASDQEDDLRHLPEGRKYNRRRVRQALEQIPPLQQSVPRGRPSVERPTRRRAAAFAFLDDELLVRVDRNEISYKNWADLIQNLFQVPTAFHQENIQGERESHTQSQIVQEIA